MANVILQGLSVKYKVLPLKLFLLWICLVFLDVYPCKYILSHITLNKNDSFFHTQDTSIPQQLNVKNFKVTVFEITITNNYWNRLHANLPSVQEKEQKGEASPTRMEKQIDKAVGGWKTSSSQFNAVTGGIRTTGQLLRFNICICFFIPFLTMRF